MDVRRWITKASAVMLSALLCTGLFLAIQERLPGKDTASAATGGESSFTPEEIADFETAVLNAWKNYQTELDVSSYKIAFSESNAVDTVYYNLLYRHPECFYVQAGITKHSTLYTLQRITISYEYTKEETAELIPRFNSAVKTALSKVDDSWSDLEIALYLHDYLCLNCEYDTSLQMDTAYDALVGKKAICQGYAMAYNYLLQQKGIECFMAMNRASNINHAWNIVRINNQYYHVDVTWDDPVNDRLGKAKHIYFLKSSSWILSDGRHGTQAFWESDTSLLPSAATSAKYDSAFWNNVDTSFSYIKGKWYAFHTEQKYLCSYTCNGKKLKRAGKLVSLAKELWYAWDSRKYWSKKYTSTAACKKKVYYSTPTEVWFYNTANGKVKKIYTLKKKQAANGYIYGIYITSSGSLKIQVSKTPGETGKTYTAKSL